MEFLLWMHLHSNKYVIFLFKLFDDNVYEEIVHAHWITFDTKIIDGIEGHVICCNKLTSRHSILNCLVLVHLF